MEFLPPRPLRGLLSLVDGELMWSWTWPSLLLALALAATLLTLRWLWRRFDSASHTGLSVLGLSLAVIEVAAWVSASPLLVDHQDIWSTAWQWLWPSLACFAIAVLAVVANQRVTARLRDPEAPVNEWLSD